MEKLINTKVNLLKIAIAQNRVIVTILNQAILNQVIAEAADQVTLDLLHLGQIRGTLHRRAIRDQKRKLLALQTTATRVILVVVSLLLDLVDLQSHTLLLQEVITHTTSQTLEAANLILLHLEAVIREAKNQLHLEDLDKYFDCEELVFTHRHITELNKFCSK